MGMKHDLAKSAALLTSFAAATSGNPHFDCVGLVGGFTPDPTWKRKKCKSCAVGCYGNPNHRACEKWKPRKK